MKGKGKELNIKVLNECFKIYMLQLNETRVIRTQLGVRADVKNPKLLKTNIVWAFPGGLAV